MGFELEDWDPERRLRELTDPEFKVAERRRRMKAGYREQLVPQQLVIADTLASPYDRYVAEISRRATKTTSIFFDILGRCALRPGYQATFSAQSGVMGSRRLREWGGILDAVNPPDDLDLPPWLRGQRRISKSRQRQLALFGEELLPEEARDRGRRGFRIMRGEVGKGIYFENESQFLVLKPDPDAYRSEGADVSWFDEFQEVDPDEGDELLAAVLPLQDTKIGSSIIVSGTAGPARVGPFWKWVDKLRAAGNSIGGLDYAAAEDLPWELIEDEESAMKLLVEIHPGVNTLTTLDKMRVNYRDMPKPQWAAEYLSVWPESYGTRAVDEEQWTAAALTKKPPRPQRVAFAIAIKPGGQSAAIAAAWRSPKGTAYVEIVEHRLGTAWLPQMLQHLSKTYRGATIAYDDIGEGKATATECEVLKPRPRLRVQTYRETAAGCVQFMRDLDRGTLRHSHQVGLDAAVEAAARREPRGADAGVWLWTPAEKGADITPLDAATRALRNWDQHYGRGQGDLKIVTAA